MELDKTYNINCFDFLKTMKDKSVDHVFTSPPYNRKRNDKYQLYNDTLADYYLFLLNIFSESLRVSKGLSFINLQTTYYNRKDIYKIIGNFADKIQNIIIWVKSNPMPASGLSITNSYEMFIVLGDNALKANTTYIKNVFETNVYSKMPKNHHAVMHPQACKYIIENFTKENELIFDPFMGTGTTARICKEFNRRYIGCEIIKEYCDMANKEDIA